MEETVHKRRKRYSGTHPRHFDEKYKEHDPDKYQDTIAKVIAKGSTPAGMHISIMVKEILEVLKIQPGETGLDATLGYGGHSMKILERLTAGEPKGHLYSLDVDPIEIEKTKARIVAAGFCEDVFTAIRENFANVDLVAKEHGPFDVMMADLGVSSMQIDDPKRGFSYKLDGPLDLRLDPSKGVPAGERLSHMDGEEIEGMLIENSDEPYAREITDVILSYRRKKIPVDTTTVLREIVVEGLKKAKAIRRENPTLEDKELIKKTCQRVFQALRIDVNSEFEVLEAFLTKLPDCLNSGGRVAILTFHSGEDRLVKQFFREYYRQGIFSEIAKDVIRPSQEECRQNPRARSTKLRWAIKA